MGVYVCVRHFNLKKGLLSWVCCNEALGAPGCLFPFHCFCTSCLGKPWPVHSIVVVVPHDRVVVCHHLCWRLTVLTMLEYLQNMCNLPSHPFLSQYIWVKKGWLWWCRGDATAWEGISGYPRYITILCDCCSKAMGGSQVTDSLFRKGEVA